MGTQNNILMDKSSSSEAGTKLAAGETANYVTDLLNELQMIANADGLSNLSDAIGDVLSKYGASSIAA